MKTIHYFVLSIFIIFQINIVSGQENDKLSLSGKLISDQRLLLQDENPWVWNENRLSLNLDKKIPDMLCPVI